MQLLYALLLLSPCSAQFGDFFGFREAFGGGGGSPRHEMAAPKINNAVENTYLDQECANYLCEDTLACVKTPQDCPCVFPDSQLKCEFPNREGYVCISKPSNSDGPDCQYVTDAFQGKI